ncbi:Lrp/AsnC family transcriptional regulator [Streptomyces sp. NPDC019890]|uniref:Lrp/AsnC family transcriptional regulator n=1 Tax=Streptomyces sp. NPDC019890 TaxID=3365064 RepID=UPI00384D689A
MESHAPDTLDRQLLLALDIDGRAPFSRVAAVLGVSDQTVARRFRRLRADVGVRVVGVRDVERLGQERWMLRLRCTPDAAFAIARALARRPDTAWIGLASGGTEVVGMIRMRTRGEHDELLLGKLPRTPSIVEIRAHQLLHGFYGGPAGWLGKQGALTPEQAEALRPVFEEPSASGVTRITEDDEPLVAALEADGRASFAELQKATGRSESAVRRRLDQLLRSGALFIDVQFDSDAFGYGTRALLWITAAPSALEAVGRALATHPEVAFAAATAGHCNLVAVIVCRDTASVYRYLNESLGRLAGVQHVECAPVLRTVKQLRYEERR